MRSAALASSFFAAIQDLVSRAESDFVFEKTRGWRPNDFRQR
jgi:hypothetical protein